MHYRILFFILIFTSPVLCQTMMTADELRASFDEPDSVKWISTYDGLVADFHPVKIILGFNGLEYLGQYQLKAGGSISTLYGEDQNDQTILFETDKSERETGYIVGQVSEAKINGVWSDDEVESKLAFRALASRIIPLKKFTPAILQMMTTDLEEEIQLTLVKEAPGQLAGSVYFEEGNRLYQVLGECKDISCENWVIHLFDATGVAATMRTVSRKKDALTIMYTESTNEKLLNFSSISDYPLEIKSLSSDESLAALVLPDLGSAALDEWTENQTHDWWQSIEKTITAHSAQDDTALRFSRHWNGWADIGFLSADACSGMISLVGPDDVKHLPFLVNLEKDRMVNIEDVFKKGVKLDEILDKYQNEHRIELLTEIDTDYDNWLKSIDFSHYYFRPDGLCMTGDFHPIYGHATMTVPYSELRDQMRKKSIVSSLVK